MALPVHSILQLRLSDRTNIIIKPRISSIYLPLYFNNIIEADISKTATLSSI
nr:hypothetical protein [Bacteroidota bacterium]